MLNPLVYFLLNFIWNSHQHPIKMPPPPGTRMINDSLYLDKELLSVESYNEFLYFIKLEKGFLGINYKRCLPDSNIQFKGTCYLTSKKYKPSYPILNLNEYQINSYCKWRSWAVNLYKDNPEKRCTPEYWNTLDLADPLHTLMVEYYLPDSVMINRYESSKQINIPEMNRLNNTSTLKFTQKHFGIEVIGIRCAARYVVKK
jgi:hypothetical protein